MISTMNSDIENVNTKRPLTDILWYAKIDYTDSISSSYNYTHPTNFDNSIVETAWMCYGDRTHSNKLWFDPSGLLGDHVKQPGGGNHLWIPRKNSKLLSTKDSRTNVINALANLPTIAPRNLGPMLYFIAETTDAKLDEINDIMNIESQRFTKIEQEMKDIICIEQQKFTVFRENMNNELLRLHKELVKWGWRDYTTLFILLIIMTMAAMFLWLLIGNDIKKYMK